MTTNLSFDLGPNSLEEQDHASLLKTTRRLLAEVQAMSSRIAAVQEIANHINRSLDLESILEAVGRQAKWVLDFDHCSVCLVESDGAFALTALFDMQDTPDTMDLDEAGPVAYAIRTGQSQLIKYNKQPVKARSIPYASQVIVPLPSEGDILGTINFAHRQPNHYTQEDLRIAYLLAMQLAAAIRNARRFEEVNRLYRELEQTYTLLQHSESLREDLTRMIVHDLRNPLSVIQGNLDLLYLAEGNVELADHTPELLSNAHEASERMIGLIDDILNVSKFEAGELKLVLVDVSINELLTQKRTFYQAQAQRSAKHFTLHIPDQPIMVNVDRELLNRIIDNLISNALKYTESGGHIELGLEGEVREFPCVYVRDDGEGIPLEYQSQIFNKFTQVTDERGAALRKGTGLGLAFCKMAVEAHGGKIWVESAPGEGSTFKFTLPRA